MDSPHLEQYSLEGSSFFPFSFFATPIVISSSIYATVLRAEFYIFLKKQFTPPPLCAALGLYIAKALKPIVLLGLSVSFYLLLAVPLIVF